MTRVDAGPLVAIINRGEADHARRVAALSPITLPRVTTWRAFTEAAMYLLGEAASWPGQAALWRLVERGDLELAEMSAAARVRMPALMEKYRDLPMDLADSSLVALAEEHRLNRVFSRDRDFRVYHLPRGPSFDVIP